MTMVAKQIRSGSTAGIPLKVYVLMQNGSRFVKQSPMSHGGHGSQKKNPASCNHVPRKTPRLVQWKIRFSSNDTLMLLALCHKHASALLHYQQLSF
jgi:hypothetical protein